MKPVISAMVCLCVVVTVAGFSSAQVLVGSSDVRLGNGCAMGGFVGKVCGPGASPKEPGALGLAVCSGYVGGDDGASVSFGAEGDGDNLAEITQSCPVNGLWLGGSATMAVSAKMGVLFNGGCLIGAEGEHSDETSGAAAGQTRRRWKTDTSWWNLATTAIINLGGPTAALAGFRYDAFDTAFRDPQDTAAPTAGKRGDLTVRAFMPYLGLMINRTAPADGAVSIGLVGVPTVVGTLQYSSPTDDALVTGKQNLGGGYFLELFAEYTARFASSGTAGLFFTWTTLNAVGTLDLGREGAGIAAGDSSYDYTFKRTAWIFGGKVGVDFGLPF